mmetsp:Transcript_1227/g.2787  ORF Transcript_1227/g.2787 Transcript_1227/m.2787 type:complete len:205 (-) Transcript_1227:53-667(-)
MIAHLWCSGNNSLRMIPMEGKYIPTHASNAKNEAMIPKRLCAWMALADHENDAVEINKIPAMMFFTQTDFFWSWPNRTEPNRQHAIKHEKIVPKGVAAFSPKEFRIMLLRAGGQTRTKMYIEPSKRLCTNPTKRIFGSEKISITPPPMEQSPVGRSSFLFVSSPHPSQPFLLASGLSLFSTQKYAVVINAMATTSGDTRKGPVG